MPDYSIDIQAEYAKLDLQPRPNETLDDLLAVEMDIIRLEALLNVTAKPADRAAYTQRQREAVVKRAKLRHRLVSAIAFQAELELAGQSHDPAPADHNQKVREEKSNPKLTT